MAHPLRPRRPEREQAPVSASQSTHLRRGHGRYRSLSIMKARDRGLRVCLGALLTLRGLGQKGHSERVGDGWGGTWRCQASGPAGEAWLLTYNLHEEFIPKPVAPRFARPPCAALRLRSSLSIYIYNNPYMSYDPPWPGASENRGPSSTRVLARPTSEIAL